MVVHGCFCQLKTKVLSKTAIINKFTNRIGKLQTNNKNNFEKISIYILSQVTLFFQRATTILVYPLI